MSGETIAPYMPEAATIKGATPEMVRDILHKIVKDSINQYQRSKAAYKIDGYMMSSPQLSREEVFAAAKARCIEELKKQVAHVESVTLEQYEHEKKKDF